jgi:hypothetical protein
MHGWDMKVATSGFHFLSCEVCKGEVSRGWMDSFISCHVAGLTEKKSSPPDEPRLQVPRIFLEETRRSVYETVQDRPADLVFNLDEVRVSNWEDRKPKKAVVPIIASANSLHHRTSRNVRYVSIVAAYPQVALILPRMWSHLRIPGLFTGFSRRPGCRSGSI